MIPERRGKNVAIAGAGGQLVLAAVMLAISLWTNSLAAMACTLLIAAGIPLWLMVGFLLYCRQLQQLEEIELKELAAQGATTGTIFEREDGLELRPGAARAAFANRWIVPIFTLLWAALHATLGLLLLGILRGKIPLEITNPAPAMLIILVAGFAAFLFSRYTTGMSRGLQWRLLRATGSYLLINVLFIAAVLGAMIAAHQGKMKIDLLVAFAAPIIQFILAGELVLNVIFDIYRPRLPGQEHRPSFDSRLCSLVADPGRIGHSIAESLNYQFGFEVSKTWFYQLLSRAFVPLLIFASLIMFAMSSIVLVRHGEQYMVLHWGRVERVLGPGLHFKWVWPIDTAQRFVTGKVNEMLLGVGSERQKKIIKGREVDLWTEEHGSREENDFLVAVRSRSRTLIAPGGQEPPPPINIIKLVVAVQYVIEDVYKFGYQYVDAAKLLECVAYREMSRYCASATLDSPAGEEIADRPEAIMTYGRKRTAETLKQRIQQRTNELDLGVKILYVALRSVHPPTEVAKAYQSVLEAERRMLQQRYEAEAQANKTLVQVAGSPLVGLKLALAIRTMEELEKLRENPSRIELILDEQIRHADDDIKGLEEETRQERLLGRIQQGSKRTPKQELLAEHLLHLELLQKVRQDASGLSDHIARARIATDELFARTVGYPARIEAQAQGYRWTQELTEMARSQAFKAELLAYRASPEMYMTDRWLDVWDEVLPGITKYVIGVDRNKLEIWLNWERETAVMEGAYIEEPKE